MAGAPRVYDCRGEDVVNRNVWPFALLAAAVVIGRIVDRTLRRRLGGRFNSPWGVPDVSPAQEGAGWLLLVVGMAGAALLVYACPFPRIE
jgi:hypothetical protein